MNDDTAARSLQGIPIRQTIPLTGMKRMIADHMLACHQQVPAVSVLADFEVGELLKSLSSRRPAGGSDVRPTLTHMAIKLVADALRKFPLLNATIEDGAIRVLDEVNIGMAVALPDGNLVVPVIRNADRKTLDEIAHDANRLATSAATGKLTLDDVRGGTFTLTNVGMVRGTLWQTPLVNLPQCAILALGRARDCPVVRGGQLAVGKCMGASLSFDHRIVNGFPASQFMEHLAECFGNRPVENSSIPDLPSGNAVAGDIPHM